MATRKRGPLRIDLTGLDGAAKIDEERGMTVELADVCETCDGSGSVRDVSKWSVDTGTKWQRNYEEEINVECPDCDGDGYSR